MLLGGVAAAMALQGGQAALAADIPMPVKAQPAPAPSWGGCYGGVQLGGVQSSDTWHYRNLNVYDSSDPGGPMLVTDQAFRALKVRVGAQAGCNLSYSGPWMLGMELGWIASPMDRTINTDNVQ